jgi:DNA polymerase delta subunit 3
LLAEAVHEALGLHGGGERKSSLIINNPHVRRRERPGKLAASTVAAKSEPKPALSKTIPEPPKAKEEVKSAQPALDFGKATSSAPVKKPVPALKRGGSSNSGIMQAFSKASTKVKQVDKPKPAAQNNDDTIIQAMSDDGEDDEDEVPQPKTRGASSRKSKKEREEELRQMMDEDETPIEEPVEEPVEEAPVKDEPAEVVTTSANGRRRGKRRITRKKQIMDEQGYLGMSSSWCDIFDRNLTIERSYNPGSRLGVFLGG